MEIILSILRRPYSSDDVKWMEPEFVGPFESKEVLDTWVESLGGWKEFFSPEWFLNVDIVRVDHSPQEFLVDHCETVFMDENDPCLCGEHAEGPDAG